MTEIIPYTVTIIFIKNTSNLTKSKKISMKTVLILNYRRRKNYIINCLIIYIAIKIFC